MDGDILLFQKYDPEYANLELPSASDYFKWVGIGFGSIASCMKCLKGTDFEKKDSFTVSQILI
jgi:hypothetical protein